MSDIPATSEEFRALRDHLESDMPAHREEFRALRTHLEAHGPPTFWSRGPARAANRSARIWAMRETLGRRSETTHDARVAFWRRVAVGRSAEHSLLALLRRASVERFEPDPS